MQITLDLPDDIQLTEADLRPGNHLQQSNLWGKGASEDVK
jgi:hypothetical protein